MDYVEELDIEARDGNAAFHEFVLALAEMPEDAYYAFFEGDDDPSFYMPHITYRLGPRKLMIFICNGRSEVLKANELISGDGRAADRVLFFVDKDHTDIVSPGGAVDENTFQTTPYSIENYLVSEEVWSRYWIERLHLSAMDSRLVGYTERYRRLRREFHRRSRILMAIVLFGRGVDGRPSIKMNLNNVELDSVFNINVEGGFCTFRRHAGRHFLAASNILKAPSPPTGWELRGIYRKFLASKEAGSYIRGKYELWFFWKVLNAFTRELSDKKKSKELKMRRATPTGTLPRVACVEQLSPLLSCPEALASFLDTRIPIQRLPEAKV